METIVQEVALSLNSRLSKQLQVTPLQPGEEVEFELLNAFKKEKGREEPSCPEYWGHVEKQTIYDPGFNRSILIENIVGWEPVETPNGEVKHKPIRKKPEFIRGVCKVRWDQPDTYIYMMRSNANIDNPFRRGRTKGVFRMRNKKRELTEQLESADLSWTAEKLVREQLDWTGRRAIVEKLNQSPDAKFHIRAVNDLDKTLLELIALAKQYPKKIIMASTDKQAKIRVQIADCEAMRLLTYDRLERSWRQVLNGGKEVRELCVVDADKDRIEALLDHFRTDEGRKHYMSLLAQLDKIFKATA